SLRIAGTHLASDQTDSNVFNGIANLGLLFLGVPYIIQAFFRRAGRWHAEQYPAPEKVRKPVTSGLLASLSKGIHRFTEALRPVNGPNHLQFVLSFCALVMILVLINTGQFQAYQVPVPGQGCRAQQLGEW